VIHRSELRSEVSTLLRYLVARPVAVAADRIDGDPLGLPSFRPLSFLSNLAERVLPTETEIAGSNGHPAPSTAPPSPAPAVEAIAEPPATPEPDVPDPSPEESRHG
jgi:hypothetical protein